MFKTADKIMSLNACTYNQLPINSKVFNSNKLDYYLWIYLNPCYVRNCYFLGATDISPEIRDSHIFPDTFSQESTCWIKVNTTHLGHKPGKRTFKLSFVNRITDDCFSLYVSYYLQVDDPDKPYVYMKPKVEEIDESHIYHDPIMPCPTLTPYMTEDA